MEHLSSSDKFNPSKPVSSQVPITSFSSSLKATFDLRMSAANNVGFLSTVQTQLVYEKSHQAFAVEFPHQTHCEWILELQVHQCRNPRYILFQELLSFQYCQQVCRYLRQIVCQQVQSHSLRQLSGRGFSSNVIFW